jgi:lipopolysaccharide transport system ATP-binding protein
MNETVLIKAENVSKKFCRSLKKSLWYGLKDITGELVGRNGSHHHLRPDEFWAVNEVSFQLRRGECLGLIGCNGAGKTTLLKMLNGLIKPDRGRIEMSGRVGALIALGAGFNPILTGRENIYVNGSVLGLSKREINARINEIIDFADIGDFIDTPVQSYSSGMQVRLGFAIATALEPDILLLDEVLAVGDAAFRAKCYNRISKLQQRAAVIFVTHSMEQMTRVCTKALCLNSGNMVHMGSIELAIQAYCQLNTLSGSGTESFLSLGDELESGSVQVTPTALCVGGTLDVRAICSAAKSIGPCRLRVLFYAEDGTVVGEYDSRRPLAPEMLPGNRYVYQRTIGPINLLRGRYKLGINLLGAERPCLHLWSNKEACVEIDGPLAGLVFYQIGEQ